MNYSDFSSVEEHTFDRRSLHRRIYELERRDREIKDVLKLCENEKFAWEHLCDISKNIYLLKQKYNEEFPEIGENNPDSPMTPKDGDNEISFLENISKLEKEIKDFYRIVTCSRQQIYKMIKEKCNLSDISISLRRENAKKLEELQIKNSLKKNLYVMSKNENRDRFNWENIEHKNALKSLWDNNNMPRNTIGAPNLNESPTVRKIGNQMQNQPPKHLDMIKMSNTIPNVGMQPGANLYAVGYATDLNTASIMATQQTTSPLHAQLMATQNCNQTALRAGFTATNQPPVISSLQQNILTHISPMKNPHQLHAATIQARNQALAAQAFAAMQQKNQSPL